MRDAGPRGGDGLKDYVMGRMRLRWEGVRGENEDEEKGKVR